ncbi:MAG: hypothetical protein J0H09_17190 [Burkholderiales bacterium]|nr:hypothetical protein [Burkholderiales bacterium]
MTATVDLPPLIITGIDAMLVRLPLKKPMLMAGVRIEAAENLLVRIEAADGTIGWGEAASAPTMTGDLPAGMLAAVALLRPLLMGRDAFAHPQLSRACQQALHGSGAAKSALDMAVLDLCGRRLGVPLWALLGGKLRNELRPMFLLGNPSVQADIEEARDRLQRGIGFFKIKVGVKPLAEEIDTTHRLREALGSDVTLCADANMGFAPEQARRYAQAVAQADLLFLEQPLRSEDLRGMAMLARNSPVPLCADEPIGSVADILDYHAAAAAQGINLKTIKLGGVSATAQAAVVCQALGLSINLACKVAESSIGAAALVQLGATVGNLDWGLSITNHYLAEELTLEPIQARDGVIRVPDRPGLGIDVDVERVQRFRVC